MEPLAPEVLAALQHYSAPTLANAIELFDVRPRSAGFASGLVRCVYPDLPPMVGYAATAKMRAATPPRPEKRVPPHVLWQHILSLPAPRVVVIQDLDDPPAVGSYWGEVNANVHKALGCVGVATDGGVRDLDEVAALGGFQFFAREVIVSHAYVHLVEVGGRVTVGGLDVRPGDLLHGDKHGVLNIPQSLAADLPAAVERIEARERAIITLCQSPEFGVERLRELFERPVRT